MAENDKNLERSGREAGLLEDAAKHIMSGDYGEAWEALSVLLKEWEKDHPDYSFNEVYHAGGRNVDRFANPSMAWEVFWVTHNAPDNPRLPRYILDFIKWLFDKKEERDAGD